MRERSPSLIQAPVIHRMILCNSNCQVPTWTSSSGRDRRSEGEGTWTLTSASWPHLLCPFGAPAGPVLAGPVLAGPAPTGCLNRPTWWKVSHPPGSGWQSGGGRVPHPRVVGDSMAVVGIRSRGWAGHRPLWVGVTSRG